MKFIEKLNIDGYDASEEGCMPVILVEKLEESIGIEKPMECFFRRRLELLQGVREKEGKKE